jgi:hypothetical protein
MPNKKKNSLRNSLLPANDDRNYIRQEIIAKDSYSNVPARIGEGTPNLTQSGQYPLLRITEDYPLILSLYRSSWVVRRVIDSVANDMYSAFPILDSQITPQQITSFHKVIKKTDTVKKLKSAAKWGRLFGGAACIIVIDGHDDLMEPLDVDEVEIGSYKGLIPLDRWSGIIPGPEIDSDVNNPKNFGLPTYYTCIMDAGSVNVHHSRIIRFTGRELPQWEVQVELYWGMSEVEVIFDELRKRDYSSWNIISLLTRAQILSIEEPQLATLMSGAGGSNTAYNNFTQRMESISQLLNNQGLLVLGKDGKLNQASYSFGGISDVYHEFMKDLSAACEIPYEIVFGRESGMGGGGNFSSNGQSSLQLYDNMVEQKRNSEGNPVIDKLLPIICMSTWGQIPDDIAYHWAPIRSISDKERTDLGKSLVESILMAYNADLITKQEARKELAQQSGTNGLFSNISDESIAETPDKFASEIQAEQQEDQMLKQAAMQKAMMGGAGGGGAGGAGGAPPSNGAGGGKAGAGASPAMGTRMGEQVPIESKPIGVEGLKWHKSRRITTGGKSNTSAEAMKQSMRHSVKHEMKKPVKDSDGVIDGSFMMSKPMR